LSFRKQRDRLSECSRHEADLWSHETSMRADPTQVVKREREAGRIKKGDVQAGSGRIVISETEAPSMSVKWYKVDEQSCKAPMRPNPTCRP
jgi:hypothetical protein